MRENYDFSSAIKNPYKFSFKEKLLAYMEYIYKISKLDKDDFKNEVENAIIQLK